MRRRKGGNLQLGSRVIELLIPHRRPFLMVDRVDAFRLADPPRIEAHRFITMNEACFEGHFPGCPCGLVPSRWKDWVRAACSSSS